MDWVRVETQTNTVWLCGHRVVQTERPSVEVYRLWTYAAEGSTDGETFSWGPQAVDTRCRRKEVQMERLSVEVHRLWTLAAEGRKYRWRDFQLRSTGCGHSPQKGAQACLIPPTLLKQTYVGAGNMSQPWRGLGWRRLLNSWPSVALYPMHA